VGSLIKSSYRMDRRLFCLILACLLLHLTRARNLQAQVPAVGGSVVGAPTTSGTGVDLPTAGAISGSIPGTIPIGAVQIQDNSQTRPQQDQGSDRTNNRNQDQDQRRPAPIPPLPLTEFQQIVAGSTGKVLPIFGNATFNTAPSTFAPVDNVPVTPDYVIGPGDELRLQVWGQVNSRQSVTVDRTGSISLPEVGTIHVADLRYSQLSDFLKAQLGRIYKNFDLNVNLGQMRSIQVFVVGQARQPGNYTIGSLSTLLNALFASGGPLPQGSLRDIQVKRGAETVVHFDLYDLLLRGDKSKDIRLQSGDVIFIPDVGPQVAVVGSVTTPAIYELRQEKTFNEVLSLAGGETNVAAGFKVRVERIYNHTERSMIDVDLPTGGDTVPIQNGDIVLVTSILDRFKDAVTLRGNVANPGRYSWHQGMRISDLIPNLNSLVTRNYYARQNQLAQSNADYQGPAPEGSLGIQSGPAGDVAAGRRSTGTGGGGNSVGAALTADSSSFSARTDVILSAPDIDWDYAVITRQSPTDLKTTLLPFNLRKAVLNKEPAQDLELSPGDVITIFSQADIRVPNGQQTKFVKLEGEFVAAGEYSVLPGETLRQLLNRVGGFSSDAYLFASEFTRESVRRLQRQRLLEYADALESQITADTSASAAAAVTDRDAVASQASAAQARAALSRLRQTQPTGRIVLPLDPNSKAVDSLPDIALEDGDRFIVPKVPSSVTVEGQVYNANAFIYQKGKRVKDYLHLAGGPDRIADQKREFILRADGSVLSHQYTSGRQYGEFNRLDILPGDTVVVPPKIERGALLRELVSISTILQGFGIGAAAIEVLR
jgi:polysaccharide export outer membrane protein